MKRPQDFKSSQPNTEWTPIKLGGHKIRIIDVHLMKNNSNGEMLVIRFDFAPGDSQEGYFMNLYNSSTFDKPTWSFQGTKYINLLDYNGNDNEKLCKFYNFIEWSNKGFTIKFEDANGNELSDDAFCKQFKGKLIGGVYGMKENEYQGKIRNRAELIYFCTYDKALGKPVPDPILLDDRRGGASNRQFGSGQSSQRRAGTQKEVFSPVTAEEDIPF